MLDILDDHGFTDEPLEAKVAALQAAIWEIEALHPWPWVETSATLTFDGSAAVPTNWTGLNFRASVRLRDLLAKRRIAWTSLEEWEDLYASEPDSGDPALYYFEGGNLNVWPTPSAATTMRLRFIKWSPSITESSTESAILLPKQFHRGLIVNGALSMLYDMEDDAELATKFEQRKDKATALALEALFKRQYDSPDHIVVTDPSDWDCGY
jgi:hypothetical protein